MTSRMTRWVVSVAIAAVVPALSAQAPPPHERGIKYMRDSAEYAALTRQVYRIAAEAVSRSARDGAGRQWAVVLDIDDTALDNSTYELERSAYGLPFAADSWAAWVSRREAGAVPGVVEFVAAVRRTGGHVAWITNREAALADATRANLQSVGLWRDDDRLCPKRSADPKKAARRAEVVSGRGECSWPDIPMRVLAFVGDQMSDFPEASEAIPDTGSDAAFGRTCFLLPNSMYGAWTAQATRVR